MSCCSNEPIGWLVNNNRDNWDISRCDRRIERMKAAPNREFYSGQIVFLTASNTVTNDTASPANAIGIAKCDLDTTAANTAYADGYGVWIDVLVEGIGDESMVLYGPKPAPGNPLPAIDNVARNSLIKAGVYLQSRTAVHNDAP